MKSYDETLEKEYSDPKGKVAAYWKTVVSLSDLVKQLLSIMFSADSSFMSQKVKDGSGNIECERFCGSFTPKRTKLQMEMNQELHK